MAIVNQELCVGCEDCLPYCPLGAIRIENGSAVVDQNICANCYVCIRKDICPVGAFEPVPLDNFIKEFQHIISDPVETLGQTGVPGRGTEESKTNDVTGRVKKGEVGICIDMGRPGVGCRLREVEKVAMAMAKAGAILEGPENSPLAMLMEDPQEGKIKDEYLQTNMLSVIIESKCPEERLSSILKALQKVEKEIDTVFTLGLVTRVSEDGDSRILKIIEDMGLDRPIRGKVNVGLGRPLVE